MEAQELRLAALSLLQADGYKVFRFLAEDVCEDLASVLDGIQYNWGNRV